MNLSPIERSLDFLNARFRGLHEHGEGQFQAGHSEKCDLTSKLQQRDQQLHVLQQRFDQLASAHNDLTAQLQAKDLALHAAKASVADLNSQLQQRNEELTTTNNNLSAAQKEAELTLLQLHQVQEELEGYLVRSPTRDELTNQLQAMDQALHAAEGSVADLTAQLQQCRQELTTANNNLSEAQEEAKLTLLQLHQVQEELEHYFLRSRAGDKLNHALAQESSRAMQLLVRMMQLQAFGW